MLFWLLGAVLATGASIFAYWIALFNLQRLHIQKAASGASPQQLRHVYDLVEAVGSVPSTGYVLARSNLTRPDQRSLVLIPQRLADFPWSGRCIEVRNSGDVEMLLLPIDPTDGHSGVVALNGVVYFPVCVPRERSQKGKLRNIFEPSRYYAKSADLQAALGKICSKHPQDLLSYLLCVGRDSFEFDPIYQARIGNRASWIQRDDTPSCPHCQKSMQLVVQLPGLCIGGDANPNDTYYFLGCKKHLEVTALISQRT